MRNSVRGSVAFLLLAAPVVHAGMLYKCMGPKDAVTIQSDPCPAGSTEVWKRDSTPAPQPTLQQVVANAVQQGHDAAKTSHAPPVVAAAPIAPPPAGSPTPPPGAPMPPPGAAMMAAAAPPAPPPPSASTPSTIQLQWHDEPETPTTQTPATQPPPNNACDDAKIFANSVREKIWLGLTQDQAQRLYSWVLEQCDKD